VALTGEQEGYYALYSGSAADLAATLQRGWFHDAESEQRIPTTATLAVEDVSPQQLIHCIQNHDQVGNRAMGDRLNHTVSLAAFRAASTLLLLSPYTPLAWMGQEWAASTPFAFFTDHNEELGRLVTEGRRREFAGFAGFGGPEVPDPQAESTFLGSKLRWEERELSPHREVLQLYRDLLDLRRRLPTLRDRSRGSFAAVAVGERAVALRRTSGVDAPPLLVVVNLGGALALDLRERAETAPAVGRSWELLLNSEDARYGGSGMCRLEGSQAVFKGSGALLLG
jgi:maltooligosyltrehalose trehalohydrolase